MPASVARTGSSRKNSSRNASRRSENAVTWPPGAKVRAVESSLHIRRERPSGYAFDVTSDHAPASASSGSTRQRFHARLERAPLLADGGMGTLLFSRGIPQRACLDELPTSRPDLVGALHREYLEAGAELIETVTFGANRLRLADFGLGDEAHRFNRRAAQVAREARDVVGREALVAGSIGPRGAPTRDLGTPHD